MNEVKQGPEISPANAPQGEPPKSGPEKSGGPKVHSVRYNFLMNFILTASQFLFPLITFPYVSRILHLTGNGKVAFAVSVVSYFMMVASLGIPTHGIRACAQVRDDREALSRTVFELFVINSVTTLIITVAYVASVFLVPRFRAETPLFLIFTANIVLNLFGMNWLYQALEQYDYITFRSIFFKLASIVLMFLFVHEEKDYVLYGAITVFAAAGSNILNFIRARQFIDFGIYRNCNYRRHFRPILVLFAQSLAISIYTNLDRVMLGFMKTDRDVGIYDAAVKIKNILVSLVTSFGNVLLPRMSYYLKEGRTAEYKQLAARALNATLLMSLPLSAFMILFARDALIFISGAEYAVAAVPMQLLTFSTIFIGLTGVLGIQVLVSQGKEQYVLYSVVTGAVVDFILNLILIPKYAAAGAAVATMAAEICVLAVQLFFTRDLLLEVRRKFRLPFYLLATAIGLAGAVPVFLFFDSRPFFRLLLGALAFFGLYGVTLLLLKDPDVYEILNTVRGRLSRKKA